MVSLLDAWNQLNKIYDTTNGSKEPPDFVETDSVKIHAVLEGEYRFIERLTFSSYEEIVEVIDSIYGNSDEFLALPVWMRNLAFRLACLQQPHNARIRRRAAIDLRYFGSDWDNVANELDEEAHQIEIAINRQVM